MHTRTRTPKLAASLAVVAALLFSGGSLAGNVTGTNGPDTLVGTHKADKITGKGGNDTLKGLAGNDVYHFGNGWGVDTLQEKSSYKVKGKTKPGGNDTVNTSKVTSGYTDIFLIPEWGPDFNGVFGENGDGVNLGASKVENAVGSRDTASYDIIAGGGAANKLNPGGGGVDELYDFGGYPGDPDVPAIPASDDTFWGVAQNLVTFVFDLGGGGDVLDLKPLQSTQVQIFEDDLDANGVCDLIVLFPDGASGVGVVDQCGAGEIEQFVFADTTIGAADVQGQPVTAAARRLLSRAPAVPDALTTPTELRARR